MANVGQRVHFSQGIVWIRMISMRKRTDEIQKFFSRENHSKTDTVLIWAHVYLAIRLNMHCFNATTISFWLNHEFCLLLLVNFSQHTYGDLVVQDGEHSNGKISVDMMNDTTRDILKRGLERYWPKWWRLQSCPLQATSDKMLAVKPTHDLRIWSPCYYLWSVDVETR